MSTPIGVGALERLQKSTWWERSFRRRILTATTLGGLVALLLGVLIFGVALYRIFTVSAQQGALNQATDVANTLSNEQAPNLNQILIGAQQGNAVLQVTNDQGTVLAMVGAPFSQSPLSSIRPDAGQHLADPSARTIDGDIDMPYAVVARGVSTPVGTRIVYVAQPMALELRTVRITIGLLALGGVLLLAVLLGYLTSVLNRALGRVETIRSEVAEIKDTHSGARVDVPRGDDEFSHLARTMNDMLDRLDGADAAQRRFVSNASHELRSPLATVRALVETSPGGMDADTTHLVQVETLRMQKLVEDLLTLARFDDSGATMRPVDLDLDELLLAEVRRVRGMGTTTITASIEPIRLVADELRVTQAVRNLVDNAVRHATSAVRLSCRLEDGFAVIDVDNDGDPVPVTERDTVFDRFARLDAARSRDSGGSGLGLAIVRATVEAHGGSALTTATREGWCRFELRLPVPDASPDADEPADAWEESSEAWGETPSGSVALPPRQH